MPCYTPVKIKDKNNVYQFVPCGRCKYCRLRRVRGWIMRLNAESDLHTYCKFVTLTYEVCPKSPKGRNTVRKRDFQLFMKRLRESTGAYIKYYACAEYGSQTERPHYHAILFGAMENEIHKAWENHVDGCVVNGHAQVGQMTDGGTAYTCKYIDKGKIIPAYKGDDRLPEFSLVSKNLGINFLTDRKIRYFRHSLDPFVMQNGFRTPLPRYYKDKIFDSEAKGKMNAEFAARNEEQYIKNITASGSEEKYIQDLNEYLWNQQQREKQQQKLKRNKI